MGASTNGAVLSYENIYNINTLTMYNECYSILYVNVGP